MLDDLIGKLLAGDRVALSRIITRLERDPEAAARIDATIAPHTGRAYTLGITGAPGAGKSTLVGALLATALGADQRVAVLALDPMSPLTRGAILGDRLRMEHATSDMRVYVRSMTADAHGGGLSVITPLAIRALDAAGWPWIAVETVGVGQTELDIAEAAATTVVLVNPGWGDEIQSVKAGLMEVADIFVINKSDREGAAKTRQDLQRLIAANPAGGWVVPILDTVAHRGEGVDGLWAAVAAHRHYQTQAQLLPARRKRFLALALKNLLLHRLSGRIEAVVADETYQRLLDETDRGTLSLHAASERLLSLTSK